MALILHQRPSVLLGLSSSGIEGFLLDALILSEALEKTLQRALKPAKSVKELVKQKRAKWKPPREQPIWV